MKHRVDMRNSFHQALIIILIFVLMSTFGSAAVVSFVPDACPALDAPSSTPTTRWLRGVTSHRACSIECASVAYGDCAVYHFNATGAACRLGAPADLANVWRSSDAPDCRSALRRPAVPESLATRLLAFYCFRVGFENLVVTPSILPAAVPVGATVRSKDGVNFIGRVGDFLEIDIPSGGFRQMLGATGAVTFYAKASRRYQYESPVFHVFYNRSAGSEAAMQPTGFWRDAMARPSLLHRSVVPQMFAITSTIYPTDTVAEVAFSGAAAMDATGAVRFYYNGALVRETSASTSSSGDIADTGMRLGFDAYFPFKGSLVAYAVAAANLSLSELQTLDSLC